MSGKSKRGFASMDRSRQREIAAKGGRAAHAKGTAHVWSAEEAREAGRRGGEIVSQDRSHMSAIGKEGGDSRSASLRAERLNRTREQALARATAAMEREVAIASGDAGPLSNTQRPPTLADRTVAPVGREADRKSDRTLDRTIERSRDRTSDRSLERSLERARPALEQRDMP